MDREWKIYACLGSIFRPLSIADDLISHPRRQNRELAAIFEAAVADVTGPKFKAVAETLNKSDTQVRDVWRRRLHKGIVKVRSRCSVLERQADDR